MQLTVKKLWQNVVQSAGAVEYTDSTTAEG